MDSKIQTSDTGQVLLEGGQTMAVITDSTGVIQGMPITLSTADNENLMSSDGSMDKHLHVPVTFVVSDPTGNMGTKLVRNDGNSAPVISAINLQDGETTTQFFIEHISTGGSQMQTEDGEAIQIGVNPHMATMTNGNGVPVLLQVAENLKEHSDEGVMDCAMEPEGDGTSNEGHPGMGQEDGVATMYTIHLTEEALTSENSQVDQQNMNIASVLESSGDLQNNGVQQVTFTQGETPSLQLLAASTRLEDFMDVVTTYKCKFCRFSCAWKSGLMSHIRSCHLEASQKGVIISPEDLPVNNVRILSQNNDSTKLNCSTNAKESTSQLVEEANSCVAFEENLQCTSENSRNELSSLPANNSLPPLQERHIFLCGQCSQSFETLDGCKQHMFKDHNLKIDTGNRSTKNTPKKKRTHSKAKSLHSAAATEEEKTEKNSSMDKVITSQNEENDQDQNKIKAPNCLEVDYLLGTRKKRMYRDTMSDRPYKCGERGCGYRFRNKPNLQYHARCHNNDGEKLFMCPECSEPMDYWRSVAMHLWKVHSIDLDLHTCSDCGYKSYSLFKLDNHKRIHREEREFVCQTCGKGFKQLSQLRNHHVIHLDRKNMPEKRWYSEQECNICHRRFSDSKCLRKHQQAVHNKLKPYICNFCGHTSARKAMLQLHMRQHTGEKPFVCDYCEYRTGDHNSLRRHRMRHTGTKPYKCPHCTYACIQAISYKTHLKNKHPGMSGLYACPLCSFRSVSNENFMNHMSDHKRGDIPIVAEPSSISEDAVDRDEQTDVQSQLHLPETTLQQLEGILPGNMTAAQLIYSCLNALSQEGGTLNLPPGVTTTSMGDGTQTITIQLPTPMTQEIGEGEQYYLTIQQDSTQALISPSSLETQDGSASNDDILQPITILQTGESQDLDSNSFITPEIDSGKVDDGNQGVQIVTNPDISNNDSAGSVNL